MKKSDSPIIYSATEIVKLGVRRITHKLIFFPFIIVAQQGKAYEGYEIHPPGTGKRLIELERQLEEKA